MLEVGCATGIATRPLAERGFNVVCVELGEDLARVAEGSLAAYPQVQVIHADFESWVPTGTFDLLIAATSWHWLDPDLRYQRAWEALRSGGHLAFWSATHVFPDHGDRFFREIQDVYEQIGEGLAPDASWPRPGELPDSLEEIERSGLFSDAIALQFDWEIVYGPDGYIDLLDTFSGHIAMAQWQRDRLYGEIRRRLAERPDGRLSRGWGAVLHVARRRDTE